MGSNNHNEESLEAIFEQFCAFGETRASSNKLSSPPSMDNAKFAKFAKDTKIIGKGCTTTDVDIIFKKAKPKNERRLDFEQFKEALKLLAHIKYPKLDEEEAFNSLVEMICYSKGPTTTSATNTDTKGVYDKLLDHNQYTGTHKGRFNSDGSGRRMEGRDSVVKGKGSQAAAYKGGDVKDLSEITRNTPKVETNQRVEKRPKATTISNEKLEATQHQAKKVSSRESKEEPETTENYVITNMKLPSPGNAKGSDVFNRLTDTRQYTGSHKERFSPGGTDMAIFTYTDLGFYL